MASYRFVLCNSSIHLGGTSAAVMGQQKGAVHWVVVRYATLTAHYLADLLTLQRICVSETIITHCLQRYLQHRHCSVLVWERVYVQKYYRVLAWWRIYSVNVHQNTGRLSVNSSAIDHVLWCCGHRVAETLCCTSLRKRRYKNTFLWLPLWTRLHQQITGTKTVIVIRALRALVKQSVTRRSHQRCC